MHALQEEPIVDLLVLVDVDISDSNQILNDEGGKGDLNEHVIANLTLTPVWVQQTLQEVGDLVGDPADTQRTRSQFSSAPQALSATDSLMHIHRCMVSTSDP